MPRVKCPNGHKVKVSGADVGTIVECPSCKSEFEAENPEEDGAEMDTSDEKETGKPGKLVFYGQPIPFWINAVLGKPMLLFGLVLAVIGRGCDATGARSVSRAEAQYHEKTVLFDLEAGSKIAAADYDINKLRREQQKEIEAMDQKDFQKIQEKREAHSKAMEPLTKKKNELVADQALERSRKASSDWKPYLEASFKAADGYRMMCLWYESMFIAGTIILTLGLLIVAFTGQGAECWVAYIMIGIITLSVYVGGTAWVKSVELPRQMRQGPPGLPQN